jgi:hypothetical protein
MLIFNVYLKLIQEDLAWVTIAILLFPQSIIAIRAGNKKYKKSGKEEEEEEEEERPNPTRAEEEGRRPSPTIYHPMRRFHLNVVCCLRLHRASYKGALQSAFLGRGRLGD